MLRATFFIFPGDLWHALDCVLSPCIHTLKSHKKELPTARAQDLLLRQFEKPKGITGIITVMQKEKTLGLPDRCVEKKDDEGSYMDNNKLHPNRSSGIVPSQEATLRRQAEAKLQAWEELQPEVINLDNFRWYVHELRVHQIELEIQNEELRLSEQQLEASQGRFKALYDFAPVGYVTVSEEGLILEANRTAAVLWGVAAETLVRQPISRFILPEDQDIYYHHRMAIFETAEPQSCKLRLLRTGHPPFWARLETAPGMKCGLGPSVCCIILSDIHDGVLLAAEKTQLEVKYRQLQKADSLGIMAGAIAHHFNNLLGVVLGNLELASDELPKGTDVGDNINSAMAATRRAAEVSGSMLTYLGQALGKLEPLDFTETCRTALDRIREIMPKTVDLVVDFPAGGPMVNANAHQLQQVLKSLATNGWEALTDTQRIISLVVKTVTPMEIPETHHFPLDWQVREDLYACLEVTDTGYGIDTPDIEKIFDPFFSSKFLGRGLGLPIVLGIVRAHGGVVTVASEVNRGSVFSVFLPVFVGKISQPPRLAIKTPAITGGGTILVVDDEPTLCELAKAMLIHLGYSVLVAKDGIEALEVFRLHRESIRCVLCDLSMPRMDGWQTLSALRRLAPNLPVILSSGYDKVHAMVGHHSQHPQFFLGKPYDFAGLQEAIQQALTSIKVKQSEQQTGATSQ